MRTIMAVALGVLTSAAVLVGQTAGDTLARQSLGEGGPEAHVALAKTAAGDSYQNLFNFLCTVPAPRGGGSRGGPRAGGPPGPP
jgi:hypothetical protein